MNIARQLPVFLLVFALVLSILPSSRADVTLSGTINFNYDSGAGATGTVRTTGTYTLASPIMLTTTRLFFNLTGETTGLPSSQFQFYGWNTTSTGAIPITLQTGAVYPTYILNVASYSYSNPNITLATVLSNKTVTADFGLLNGYGVKVYQSTGTIPSAPTLVASVLSFTVTDSGAGAGTTTHVYGTGGAPSSSSSTLNGHTLPAGIITYNAGADTIALVGVGAWVLDFTVTTTTPPVSGGGGGQQPGNPTVTTPISLNVLDPIPMLTVRVGEINQTQLPLSVEAPWSYTLWNVTFDKNWVQATGLPLTYTPNIQNPSGEISKPVIPITLNATHTPAPGDYLVNVGVQWVYGLHHMESSGRFHVRVLPAQGTQLPTTFSLTGLTDWFQGLSFRDQTLLAAIAVAIVIIGIWSFTRRRREDHYWAP